MTAKHHKQVSIPEPIHRRLKFQAWREDRTIGQMAEKIITDWLAGKEQEDEKKPSKEGRE